MRPALKGGIIIFDDLKAIFVKIIAVVNIQKDLIKRLKTWVLKNTLNKVIFTVIVIAVIAAVALLIKHWYTVVGIIFLIYAGFLFIMGSSVGKANLLNDDVCWE